MRAANARTRMFVPGRIQAERSRSCRGLRLPAPAGWIVWQRGSFLQPADNAWSNQLTNVALVAGANGIIGKALLEEIARTPAWRGTALSRRNGDLVVDLEDAEASRAVLAGARDVTHVFYAAYAPGGGLGEEDRRNSTMLGRHGDDAASPDLPPDDPCLRRQSRAGDGLRDDGPVAHPRRHPSILTMDCGQATGFSCADEATTSALTTLRRAMVISREPAPMPAVKS